MAKEVQGKTKKLSMYRLFIDKALHGFLQVNPDKVQKRLEKEGVVNKKTLSERNRKKTKNNFIQNILPTNSLSRKILLIKQFKYRQVTLKIQIGFVK